jgi:hypothetical protein
MQRARQMSMSNTSLTEALRCKLVPGRACERTSCSTISVCMYPAWRWRRWLAEEEREVAYPDMQHASPLSFISYRMEALCNS